jgi:hypothetical protein
MGSLGQQLNGEVRLAYAPTGFIYTMDVPMTSLVHRPEQSVIDQRSSSYVN